MSTSLKGQQPRIRQINEYISDMKKFFNHFDQHTHRHNETKRLVTRAKKKNQGKIAIQRMRKKKTSIATKKETNERMNEG